MNLEKSANYSPRPGSEKEISLNLRPPPPRDCGVSNINIVRYRDADKACNSPPAPQRSHLHRRKHASAEYPFAQTIRQRPGRRIGPE
jgi:hypothetical protein